MKVEIVSTQNIRPPPAAAGKCFTLSIFDQLMPTMYIPIILFYSATTPGDHDLQISEKSDRLKKSLSETLTHFFPQLAGRISDNLRIVADEESAGIEYTEARVRGVILGDILSPPNFEAIGKLLPAVNNSSATERLLVVRQSVFECGGMAIGICISHKVVDGAAAHSFLRSWSETARGGGRSSDMAAATPYLGSASRFPPSESFATATFPAVSPELNEFTSRRFVLSGSQVASLKAKSRSQSVANPSRVEAVSSLIWECAIRSKLPNMKNNPSSSSSSSSNAWQAVNLRNRIDPPLPENTFGNLLKGYKATEDQNTYDLVSLASKLRHAKEEYTRDFPKKLGQLSGDRLVSAICEPYKELATTSADNYFFSSVCTLDLYGAGDFGWGKPIWATFYFNLNYTVVLSDYDGQRGIQVWLSLPKQQMDVFENDPLLLSYATLNPSIIDQYQTSPHRRFARVSTPGFHFCPSRLIFRPNLLSQILRRTEFVPQHYSTRPICNIHSRVVAPSLSIRFISSLLHLHRRKLIIR